MNLFYVLDVSSLAILLPPLFLSALILTAAIEKDIWSSGLQLHPTMDPLKTTLIKKKRVALITANAFLFLTLTIVSLCLLNWCFDSLHFGFIDNRLTLPSYGILINKLPSFGLTMCLVGILQIIAQLKLFQTIMRQPMKTTILSSQFIVALSLMTALLLISTTFLEAFFSASGFLLQSPYVMRELFRISVAIACLPMSLLGSAVACSGLCFTFGPLRNSIKSLQANNIPALNDKSNNDLYLLINAAVKMHKIDAAELISKELSQRIEKRS